MCGAAALLAACASQPRSPYYGDERFLVLGVRPDAEAGARRGARAQRLRGDLEVERPALHGARRIQRGRRAGKVRIVTARGIALALDPVVATPLTPGIRYALMPPPVEGHARRRRRRLRRGLRAQAHRRRGPVHPRLPRARLGLRGRRAERAVRARAAAGPAPVGRSGVLRGSAPRRPCPPVATAPPSAPRRGLARTALTCYDPQRA